MSGMLVASSGIQYMRSTSDDRSCEIWRHIHGEWGGPSSLTATTTGELWRGTLGVPALAAARWGVLPRVDDI
jgi:hypothetical protein